MKVLIIEDEDLAALRLKKMLEDEVPDIQVSGPIDTIKNAVEHLSQYADYDLLFLDIQLADGKSFTIFEKMQVDIPVIFTTAYDEFAIRAFDLNSVDYLLKPVQQAKLHQSIEKFRKLKDVYNSRNRQELIREIVDTMRIHQQPAYQSRFLVSKGESLFPVPINDIAYFQAEEKVVFLVQNDAKRFILNYSLDELEQKVDPALFFRVNRQFLVAVHAIARVHHFFNYKLKLDLHPSSTEDVMVSRLKSSEFKSWLNR